MNLEIFYHYPSKENMDLGVVVTLLLFLGEKRGFRSHLILFYCDEIELYLYIKGSSLHFLSWLEFPFGSLFEHFL
jgi:hypothetical protein